MRRGRKSHSPVPSYRSHLSDQRPETAYLLFLRRALLALNSASAPEPVRKSRRPEGRVLY